MKLSILIIVIVRLVAILWFVHFCIGMLGVLAMKDTLISHSGLDVVRLLLLLASPLSYGLFAFLAWFFTEGISRRVVGQTDPKLTFHGIRSENLYTLGILTIGLYYALENIAMTCNWFHFMAVNRAGQEVVNNENGLSFYDVSSVIITFAAGVTLALLSPKLGAKLARATRTHPIEEDEKTASSQD